MAKNIAYIRISDEYRQDTETQLNAIKEYAEKHGFIIDTWIEESISGSKTKISDRKISKIINELDEGDRLFCTEVSRLGRDKPFSIISIINEITEVHKAELHLAYSDQFISADNVENAEILFTIVGASYVARQEAMRRSERAKAACNRRTVQGLSNGRPKGYLIKSKLDEHEDHIVRALNDGTTKSQLARDLEVRRATLNDWLKMREHLRSYSVKLGMNTRSTLVEIKKACNEKNVTYDQVIASV
ncbi:Site-specific DNA recombinase [Colwellia chukchiensis]|uniref:Site-specific DNA recombinase n=1 Tax=Colwellia chukchiensis TaxID=641665 RepID=A0A1H7TZJ6_9GAMM|nr:recombinase family protein [Colwellia chukchiensis]SEL90171.1 Site-specific DNA recombinase [Colwellia chukchiensis]